MKLLFFLLTLPAFALPTLEEARERLGSTDAELRETTSLELWKNSQNSLPLLEKLAEDRNPEIRNRAHHILRRFKMGLTPESPKELLALAESLENATPDQFPTPLKALLAHDEGLPVALVIFNQWATRDLERNKLIAKNAAIITASLLEQRAKWKDSLTTSLSPRCRAFLIQQITLDDFPMQSQLIAILAQDKTNLVYNSLKKVTSEIDPEVIKTFARSAIVAKNIPLAQGILLENLAKAPSSDLARSATYLEASSGIPNPSYQGEGAIEYQIFQARLQGDHAKVLRLNRAQLSHPFLPYENLLMSGNLTLPTKKGTNKALSNDLALLPLHQAFASPPGDPDIEALSANNLIEPITLARTLTLLSQPVLAAEILAANDFTTSAVGLLWRTKHREEALALAQQTFNEFDPDQISKMRLTLASLHLESGEKETARKVFEPLIYEAGLKTIYQKKAISLGLQLFPREKLLPLAPEINAKQAFKRANAISYFLPYPKAVAASWYEHFLTQDEFQSPMTILTKIETLLEENRDEAREIISKKLAERNKLKLRPSDSLYQNTLFLKLPATIEIVSQAAWYQLSTKDLLSIIKDDSWPTETRQSVLDTALLIDPTNPILHWHHQKMTGKENLAFLHNLTLGDPSLALKLGALTGKRESLRLAAEVADLRNADAIRCLSILAKSYLKNGNPSEAARLMQAALCGELAAGTRPSSRIPTTLENLALYLEARSAIASDESEREIWTTRLRAITPTDSAQKNEKN